MTARQQARADREAAAPREAKFQALQAENAEAFATTGLASALTLSAIKSHQTSDGYSFTAKISFDGRMVGTVENRGDGGCNLYFWNDRQVGIFLEDVGARKHDTPEGLDLEIENIMNEIEADRFAMKILRREKKRYVGNPDVCVIRYRESLGPIEEQDRFLAFSDRARAEGWLAANPQQHVKFYSEGK